MKTSEEEVYELFSNVKNEYGKYHKCIFHIHTPASYDYKLYENSSKKYETITDEEMYDLAIEEKVIANKNQIKYLELDTPIYSSIKEYVTYMIIANKLIENYIETVVIADHNTFSGIEKLEEAIKRMHKKNPKCYPQVIPGAEISCADRNHVVIMFEQSKLREIKEYITNILIDEESGTYATGLEIIQKISEFGGFSYIAHINSSDITKSGILTGGYKKRLFEQEDLKILGVSKLSTIETAKVELRNYTTKKFDYILDNDSHGIDTLLDSYFWIKGTKTDFSIIKDLYKDYDVTVSLEEPKESENYIKGIAIENSAESFLMPKDKDSKYLIIPFSQSLNCIIGGRGTGKSTILNLIEFMLSQYVHRKEDLEMICRNSRVWLLYKLDKKEYLIKFSPPVKEYSEENILKYFSERVPGYREYSMRYFFDSEKIKYIALREYIEIYKVGKNSKSIYFEKIQRKYSVLKHLFKTSYSINKLVSISFEDEKLSDFIVDTVFQDKQIVKCKNVKKATTI